jgi:hypothetical protein
MGSMQRCSLQGYTMIWNRILIRLRRLSPAPLVWLAVVIGLSAHFIGFFLFRIQLAGFRSPSVTEAYVSFIQPEAERDAPYLKERILLSDDTALFLPSVHDSSWIWMDPGTYLEDREGWLLRPVVHPVALNAEKILGAGPVDLDSIPDVADLFSPGLWDPYATLGEDEIERKALPARFGSFTFHPFHDDGKVVVKAIGQPRELADFDSLWTPCEFLVLIGVEGCIGDPLLQVSSGLVAVDRFAARWIVTWCNQQLPQPGYYRVVFGP